MDTLFQCVFYISFEVRRWWTKVCLKWLYGRPHQFHIDHLTLQYLVCFISVRKEQALFRLVVISYKVNFLVKVCPAKQLRKSIFLTLKSEHEHLALYSQKYIEGLNYSSCVSQPRSTTEFYDFVVYIWLYQLWWAYTKVRQRSMKWSCQVVLRQCWFVFLN